MTTKASLIDLNGNEMILDADGDTSITADTDDQIDFKTGGTDRASIDASGQLVVGGSTAYGRLNLQGTGNTTPNITNMAEASFTSLDDNGGNVGSIAGFFNYKAVGGIGGGMGVIRNNASDWGTSVAFYTHPSATSNIADLTERMKINPEGIVTISAQPAFGARRNGNQTGFNSSGAFGDPVIFNLEFETDRNSDYNTSTGLFTAPVDGTYWFAASVYGNVTFSQSWLTINDARAGFNDFSVSGSANTVFCSLFYAELDANDTVGFHPYNSSYSSVTIYDDNNHTYFRGGLLY